MSIINTLNQSTYVVEHNPNCPSAFLVRLAGKGLGIIDKKHVSETKDFLGYGNSFTEAATNVLRKKLFKH